MCADAYWVVCCGVACEPLFAVDLSCWTMVFFSVGCSVCRCDMFLVGFLKVVCSLLLVLWLF